MPPKHKHMDWHTKATLFDRALKGERYIDIAAKLSLTKGQVSGYLFRQGYRRRPKIATTEAKEQILNAARTGELYKLIGYRYGISSNHVNKIARKAGIYRVGPKSNQREWSEHEHQTQV
jgi:DNA-binding NarL/FixJ family response regulator